MPGNLFHLGAQKTCPHGGQVMTVATQSKVFVSNQPVMTQKDTFTITGCAFNVLGVPHPCVKLRWVKPATRIFINGEPALLSTEPAFCEAADLAPQGASIVMKVQTRVVGT